ncbi:MAG: hypothetical protein ACRDJM_01970, partial [Actinomycetota bacterium]
MKAARAALLVLALVAAPAASRAGSADQSGTLTVRAFHLATGQTMHARGALRIVAHGPATIVGTLRGDGSNPIEVIADGPVVVRGNIIGGSGAPSVPGGSVMLTSLAGIVRIEPGAFVASGSGGDAANAVRD